MGEDQAKAAQEQGRRPQERRRNYRVALHLPIVGYPVDPTTGALGPSFDAWIADVSTSGASIVIEGEMRVPRRMCLQIRSGDPPLDLVVMGRIVSVRKHPELRCGVRFDDLAPGARSELTRFVFAAAKRLGDGAKAASADTHEPRPLPGGMLKPAPSVPTGRLTVAQFAEQIGQTEGSARRLLNTGLVPGARRLNPTSKRSHWFIPATAPADYLALFRRQRVQGTAFEAPRPQAAQGTGALRAAPPAA